MRRAERVDAAACAASFVMFGSLPSSIHFCDEARIHPVEAEDHQLLLKLLRRMPRAARGRAKAHDQGSEDNAFHGVVKEKIYHLDVTGRILAVDVGARRIGLAISDASRTLARPLETIAVSGEADAVERVARRIAQLEQ